MKLIDAHVHLSDAEYAGYIDDLIADTKNASVKALVTNSVDLKTCRNDVELAQKYPNLVFAALGIHPWNVNALKDNELEETIDFIEEQKNTIKAIGEIGLDCKYETIWERQIMVFEKMLHLAETLELPVIIHSRGTTDKVVEMLPSYRLKHVLLHWFSYPMTTLSKAMEYGYFITEGPPVTYSNGIREVVKNVPLQNLLTETDGPVKYWKHPFDGKLTMPSFIVQVVQTVAEIKKIRIEEAAEQIAKNFEIFFNIKLA